MIYLKLKTSIKKSWEKIKVIFEFPKLTEQELKEYRENCGYRHNGREYIGQYGEYPDSLSSLYMYGYNGIF